MAVSADGTRLASASNDQTVKFWDLTGRSIVQTFSVNPFSVSTLALDGQGQTAVWTGEMQAVQVYSTGTGTLEKASLPNAQQSYVDATAVAVSPDGTLVAGGDYSGTIMLWTLPGGAIAGTLTGHAGSISALVMSNDGKSLVSASWDGTVKLWSLPDGTLLQTFGATNGPSIGAAALSADGTTLAYSDDSNVHVVSLPGGTPVTTIAVSAPYSPSLALSPNGQLLATMGNTGSILLWSLPGGTPLASPGASQDAGSTQSTNVVLITPDGTLLVAGDDEGNIVLWSLPDATASTVLSDPSLSPRVETEPCSQKSSNATCSCDTVCTCNSVCNCDTVDNSGGSGSGYWYPN
jgi:WD40 repeat protein